MRAEKQTRRKTWCELEEWGVWIWEGAGRNLGPSAGYETPDLRISSAITDRRAAQIEDLFVEFRQQEEKPYEILHMYFGTELGYRGVAGEHKIKLHECRQFVEYGLGWMGCGLRGDR
jgi:hypothetical protein